MVNFDNNTKSDLRERFNLRKSFSLFSIIAILILTFLLSILSYKNQKDALYDFSKHEAQLHATMYKKRIYRDIILKNYSKYGYLNIEKNSEDHRQLEEVTRDYMHEHNDILNLRIYDNKGSVIYSTVENEDPNTNHMSRYMKSALMGQSVSKLWKLEDIKRPETKIDVIAVYIPLYLSHDPESHDDIIGVIKIYKDVNTTFNLMRDNFYKIPLMLFLSMLILYVLLQLYIKKADKTISKKNVEIDEYYKSLESAQQKISKSINQVIENGSFNVRFENENLLKCWEFKNCTATDCPSYKSEDLRCWLVSGTFCRGKVQGVFANKYGDCRKCDVYKYAFRDRISMIGESFNNMMTLLENKHIELQEANEKLNRLVDIDPLTQVGNRRSLQKRIESIHLLALRYNHPYSIIICDVDYFKLYNDTYGHQKGDYVLISIANVMKTSLRKTDELFRWGGEEFLIILPEQNIESALKAAENLRASIESLGLEHKISEHKVITVSIGVACNVSENVKSISWETVIKNADEELYRAKIAGRNFVFPDLSKKNRTFSGNSRA